MLPGGILSFWGLVLPTAASESTDYSSIMSLLIKELYFCPHAVSCSQLFSKKMIVVL